MASWHRDAAAKTAGTHVHPLQDAAVEIGGVRFVGTTLWTDFLLFGQERQRELMLYCHQRMRDYSRICKTKGDWLTPETSLAMHQASLAFLERELAKPFPGKTVVISHHAPSPRSLSGGRAQARYDAAYASDLEALLPGPQAPDLWIHGHTHVANDYKIGRCRVVSNPRGYPGVEPVREFRPGLVLEI